MPDSYAHMVWAPQKSDWLESITGFTNGRVRAHAKIPR